MTLDKGSIRKSFSRAAATYDGYSSFQREVAAGVAENLASRASVPARLERASGGGAAYARSAEPVSIRVLDVGCGTGSLAYLILDGVPGSTVAAVDMALPMLERARSARQEGLMLAAGDCEELPFRSGSFDAAASSLTYQWAPDTLKAFMEALRVLKPGGLFIFSTLGPSTLRELRECYEEALLRKGLRSEAPVFAPFMDESAIRDSLIAAGFEGPTIETGLVTKVYPDLLALLTTLKMIGALRRAHSRASTLSSGAVLREASRIYAERFPSDTGGITATYEVIHAAAQRGR